MSNVSVHGHDDNNNVEEKNICNRYSPSEATNSEELTGLIDCYEKDVMEKFIHIYPTKNLSNP